MLTIRSFRLTVELFYLQLTILAFLLTIGAFSLPIQLLAYSEKVCLRSTSTDCKQRSSTVSKKTPAVSKNWEVVDPVAADPVAQDNNKRNNIQIYTEIPYQSTQNPNIHILSLSCRTGSATTGSTGCRESFPTSGRLLLAVAIHRRIGRVVRSGSGSRRRSHPFATSISDANKVHLCRDNTPAIHLKAHKIEKI